MEKTCNPANDWLDDTFKSGTNVCLESKDCSTGHWKKQSSLEKWGAQGSVFFWEALEVTMFTGQTRSMKYRTSKQRNKICVTS